MIGTTISHYTILEKLGEGGMGVVYKAEDTKLKRVVTLKFLSPEAIGNKRERERFVHEAQLAASLDHPNICTIFGIDQVKDKTFFSMAFVDGMSLKEKLKEGPLQLDEALDIVIQAARGLRAAHARGIIHRDISSSNIMVTRDEQVKIMDFGLAKLAGRAKVKQSGDAPGTVAYMSPEQARGDPVDARTDVYSLGAVLYELLTGHVPFPGDQRAALLYQIMNQTPEPLSAHRPDLPRELQLIIDRALDKDLDRRYQSAADMRADLKALVRKLGLERSGVYSTFSFTKRRYTQSASKAVLMLAVAVLLLLIVPSDRYVNEYTPLMDSTPGTRLAVLPLSGGSGDPASGELCDGLIETMTAKLIRLEQFDSSITVIPAQELYHRHVTTVPEARRVFGTTLCITGTVECSPERFKITFSVIDSETSHHLRTMLIDNTRDNMLMLQDDAIFNLAEILDLDLTPEAMAAVTAGGTNVPAAFELYLQGCGCLLRAADTEAAGQAARVFTRAIAMDSLYALAYMALGDARMKQYSFTNDPGLLRESVDSYERACSIDSLLHTVQLDGRIQELRHHAAGM